jgi:hypothetical protein
VVWLSWDAVQTIMDRAVARGLLKFAARGFRFFGNYRSRILFFCGKLDLWPQRPCH